MKSYNELKTKMKSLQQQMVKAKKCERAEMLKKDIRTLQRVWLYDWDAEECIG